MFCASEGIVSIEFQQFPFRLIPVSHIRRTRTSLCSLDLRTFYNDGKMCFEDVSMVYDEQADDRRRRKQFEKMKAGVYKRAEKRRTTGGGGGLDGGRRGKHDDARHGRGRGASGDDDALHREKEASDRARREKEEDAKVAAMWNPWLRGEIWTVSILRCVNFDRLFGVEHSPDVAVALAFFVVHYRLLYI